VSRVNKGFLLLVVAIGMATGVTGCRKAPRPRAPPRCEQGLEYRIRPSPKEPGRLMIHAVTNCSASTTWWVDRRFNAAVGFDGEESEVHLHILDSRGYEAETACVMDTPLPEASDYMVLRPGDTLEVEGRVFDCTDAKLNAWYRVRGVFRDKNPLPPQAPPGAVLFTGEVTSDECELQNLDYEEDEWRKRASRAPHSSPVR